MKLFLCIVIMVCIRLFFVVDGVQGQSLIDNDIKNLYVEPKKAAVDFKKPLKEAENEIHILLSSGFYAYKKVISSQDKPSCVFSPSCSEYAVEAFSRRGLIGGWLATFDRLSRCHGFVHPTHYPFDIHQKLFYDPLE